MRMHNYVIGVSNYVIARSSTLSNFMNVHIMTGSGWGLGRQRPPDRCKR
jgi:hypothetical protein